MSPATCSLVLYRRRGRGKRGGEGVSLRGRGGLPFLSEDMESCAVFPLRTGHDDAGRQNPGPPYAAVGGLYKSDSHSTFHVPAGT